MSLPSASSSPWQKFCYWPDDSFNSPKDQPESIRVFRKVRMQDSTRLSKLHDVYDALEIAAKTFGLKRLAPEVDKSYSTLANELSRQPNHKLGLSTVAVIIARTGDMRPLAEFCAIFQHVAVPIPALSVKSATDLWRGLSDMAFEFGQPTEIFSKAMANGLIDEKAKSRCVKEIDRLVDACLRVKTWLLPSEG